MVKLQQMLDNWDKAEKSVFRLESIPEYNIPGDIELFEKWKKGKLKINKNDSWFNRLRNTKEKGISMQRVRIVPLPILDYIKYEMEFWKISRECGEVFLFLEESKYDQIKEGLNFNPEDFWMFDDKNLVIFHYDETENLVSEEVVEDENIINDYVALEKELVKEAIPMKEFLKNKMS
jgi:hypothetical protein